MNRNSESRNEARQFSFTPLVIVRIAIIVLVILFGVGLWFRAHPIRPVTPSAEPKETTGSSEIIKPASLPAELTDPASLSVLVNQSHPLPTDYIPEDLIIASGSVSGDAIQISERMDADLQDLLYAAATEDIPLYITAGYISYETQQDYYNAQVKLVGEKEAVKTVARPGYSEHQTGLSIDFSDNNTGDNPRTADFANTDSYTWLLEHAHEYGFILRFPAGKEDITKNNFEPWHFRYVGIETAEAMYEQSADLTMEEFFNAY